MLSEHSAETMLNHFNYFKEQELVNRVTIDNQKP